MRTIDINCDVGEGVGNEKELFPMISSCNIACGGHAGSKETIRWCLELAKEFNVKVGAHPSYPDKENFGRVSMSISDADLIKSIQAQMQLFESVRSKLNTPLHHIKPHGALYNDIAKNEQLSQAFLKSIEAFKDEVYLYVPFNSVVEKVAKKNGYKVLIEAFADRNYNNDLNLVSRKEDNAIISNEEEVLKHVLRMAKDNVVKTIKNEDIAMNADTYCIHGDTPSALQILMYITEHLPEYNLQVKP
ncbi:5-oxoprolinase subunit A [Maribacter litoralis]|uniref:5-oxoprolinase subunit A n=2 Tax=Maribacter litoralis TaxID=2059726 RepID=A0A653VUG9_9FLAO|nr:5-oxoprolinase subunit A [Maribacter litoralis]